MFFAKLFKICYKLIMDINQRLNIRQTLADNLEYMLEKVNSYKIEKKNNSFDLFGDFEEEFEEKVNLVPATIINKLNILLKEKEYLGLYITSNPMQEFSAILDYVRQISENNNIHLILIDKIKKIFTKNKEMMFALEISIDGEKVEGVIFPKSAMALSPLLEEKTLYFVIGRISQPKKRKVEIDATENESSEVSDGIIIQEFVELPKLLISDLCLFTNGVMPLLQTDETRISKQRGEILEKINFVELLIDPLSFTKKDKELEIVELRLPNTLPKNTAIEIKNILNSKQTEEIIIKLLIMLPTGEYKESKAVYTISKINYGKIKNLIDLTK